MMIRPIRKVGIACTILILALAGQLTYLQVYKADDLSDDPRNVRKAIRDFTRPRGDIITADGQVVARSVPIDDPNSEFDLQREYPQADLFSHVVGYQSFVFGNVGVESTYNDELVGRDLDLDLRNLDDVFAGKENTGNVVLTLSAEAQLVAREALGGQRGSVVAIDPRTGAILAMYSNPSYDPNPLAGHDPLAVQQYDELLRAAPDKPDLARAYRERYPPGSTFKVVTAGTALDAGAATPDTQYPSINELDLPLTNDTLANFGGQSCGGSLADSFRRSCNTTFGQVGLDLGETFVVGMRQFGIYQAPPLDVSPGAAESTGPTPGSFSVDQPRFALAGIGQADVATTPLEMALVAAGVANGGVIMEPHVMAEITDADGGTVRTFDDEAWTTAVTPETAAILTQFMVSVVEPGGTGTAAQIPGVTVAGKTGTAQNELGDPHAWFIAFAPAENPTVAVAVIVEGGEAGGLGSEATGGQVAAPIARRVLEVLL